MQLLLTTWQKSGVYKRVTFRTRSAPAPSQVGAPRLRLPEIRIVVLEGLRFVVRRVPRIQLRRAEVLLAAQADTGSAKLMGEEQPRPRSEILELAPELRPRLEDLHYSCLQRAVSPQVEDAAARRLRRQRVGVGALHSLPETRRRRRPHGNAASDPALPVLHTHQ